MKKLLLAVSSFLFVILFNSCSKENNPSQSDAYTQISSKKAWTFLLYDDADFTNAYDPMDDFSQLVSSNADVNYLVLRDGENSGAAYYRIEENHNQTSLQNLKEVDMGAETTLENYLNFAKKYFPADRYIIAFYDHGGGWLGACWDVTDGNDNLTSYEIGQAINVTGGADIVLFTAPCLMGSIETAYQLRSSTRYYIGSEDLSGFIFWLGMLNHFDSYIKNNTTSSTGDVARKIIGLHNENKNAYGYGSMITMSAINSSLIGDLVASFNNVTNYYISHPDKFKYLNPQNIRRCTTDYYDFLGVLKELNKNETDTSAKKLINQTVEYFNNCLVAECRGDSTIGACGMNIYFPQNRYSNKVYDGYAGIGLDFNSDCSWGNLVYTSLAKSATMSALERLNLLLKRNGYLPR